MEVLTKTAVAEMTKLVLDWSASLRRGMCRSQRENEALKSKLLLMEGELRAVRGCGEETPDNSLNVSFEVQVCNESREAQQPEVAGNGRAVAVERIFDGELSTDPTKDDIPVEKNIEEPGALDIKYEPVDGEQVWSESLLLSEDRLEEDPKSSHSQVEQKISEENTCGTSGAAAANGGEGPLCKEEELHMQSCPVGDPEKGLQAELKQEEQPLTPTLPLLESVDLGLQIQSVWREANSLEIAQEKSRQFGGSSEHGDARLDNDFSPPLYRASQRPRSEKDEGSASRLDQKQNGRPLYKECSHCPPDYILAEMAFPLGFPGECDGSTPCEPSSDTSAEAKSPCRTEGQEEQFLRAGKRFSCSECGKGFIYYSALEKHQQVHSREKPFTCSVCDKSFSQWHALKAHESTHTGQKPHICTECGKSFHCQAWLKSHQRIHTSEKPFICEQCGKCFSWKSKLKTHQVTHTREKHFSCTVCNKSFSQLVHLKSHQRIHTGEKPFTCEQCGKCFSQTSSLKTHQVTHTGVKCFSCTVCKKSFAYLHVLKKHQRVHTGEKPHCCSECGKSFAQVGSLKAHQSVHTGEKPHRCNVCGRSFAHLWNLKTHKRVHMQGNTIQLHALQQEFLIESHSSETHTFSQSGLQTNSVSISWGHK